MAGEKILVVDDAEIICAALERELGREGYAVDSARSGAEALKMAGAKKYDLIFIDFIMPGMNGVQTCKAVKAFSFELAIIIMTGKIDGETSWKSTAVSDEDGEIHIINKDAIEKEVGKVYYIYKPFSEGAVLEAARTVLAERRK